MKIAMLSPIAWRTPPYHYGPWEKVTSLLTEALVKQGVDVTLFATKDSYTNAKLEAVSPKGYEEDKNIAPKVWECLHISNCLEQADKFDIIHNQFDFLPLTYSKLIKTPMVTTIHGFSSPKIIPVYKKYDKHVHFVAISNADRSQELTYDATIYHGIDLDDFSYIEHPKKNYLLYFGRFHPDKGAREAIEIAARSKKKLIMAGIIQDEQYFKNYIEPYIDNKNIVYIGSIGGEKRNEVLGNALALLHPISFNEPFGLSVVESLACGTPVVAFNKGSMPEIIEHEKTGFLVNSVSEAVDYLQKIDTLDRKTCHNQTKKRFSKERMASEYINLYKRIISN